MAAIPRFSHGIDKSLVEESYDRVVFCMADPVYVNRARLASSLANELVKPFNELSKKTRVPRSRLLDEAIEDLLKKYEKRMAE